MPIKREAKLPRVAIVGRTNVGKSTLWNRLTESGHALVSEQPHTTRDRKYGPVLWKGSVFELIDTGGMDTEKDEIGAGIKTQAEHAIRDADLVLFVVDARAGLMPQDVELARHVQKLAKNVWLLTNKVDTAKVLSLASTKDFFNLGFGEPVPVSANTSLGIGDLLDAIHVELNRLGKPPIPVEESRPLRIVLIGRPNVGKSSIVNSLLGEERVIVSAKAHTTREPQDTLLHYKGHDIVLIDTAGMRRRSRVDKGLEEESVSRNRAALKKADIALLVFDATEEPRAQDKRLAGLVEDTNKGVLLVANKWDLVQEKEPLTAKRYEEKLRRAFPFVEWAPMMFVSAKKGQRMTKLLDEALKIQEERLRHIDYNAVNRILKSTIIAKRPLQTYGPKSPKIYDVAQIGHTPPTFLITVHGDKQNLHGSWVKFFEKRLRQKFGFEGTPIDVRVRHLPAAKSHKKKNVHGPGMESVAGKIKEKERRVNQTRRRQKQGGHRY